MTFNPADLSSTFQSNVAAQGERVLAMNKQWMDWQLAQMKAVESGMRTAVTTSFSAAEQAMNATYEMNRLFFAAFAPKAEAKAN